MIFVLRKLFQEKQVSNQEEPGATGIYTELKECIMTMEEPSMGVQRSPRLSQNQDLWVIGGMMHGVGSTETRDNLC